MEIVAALTTGAVWAGVFLLVIFLGSSLAVELRKGREETERVLEVIRLKRELDKKNEES